MSMVLANSSSNANIINAFEYDIIDNAQCASIYNNMSIFMICILFAAIGLLQIQISLLNRRINCMYHDIEKNSTIIWYTHHRVRHLAIIIADLIGVHLPENKYLSVNNNVWRQFEGGTLVFLCNCGREAHAQRSLNPKRQLQLRQVVTRLLFLLASRRDGFLTDRGLALGSSWFGGFGVGACVTLSVFSINIVCLR